MNEKQFYEIMEKYEEIRRAVIGADEIPNPYIDGILNPYIDEIDLIRKAFFDRLEFKTGFNRGEIKNFFNHSFTKVLYEYLKGGEK